MLMSKIARFCLSDLPRLVAGLVAMKTVAEEELEALVYKEQNERADVE